MAEPKTRPTSASVAEQMLRTARAFDEKARVMEASGIRE